jgi:hypothetical protein
MRTSLAAVTALTGSLLLPFLISGSAQALTNAPDLKNVMSTTYIGTVMPVRAGGGGGFAIKPAWAITEAAQSQLAKTLKPSKQ